MSHDNSQIVKSLISQAWTAKNIDLVDELVSPNYVEYAPFGELHGINEYKEGIRMFTAAFPDISLQLDELVAQNDTVAFRLTVTGTHQAEFMGVEATGNRVQFVAFDFSRLENGKVVEEWFTMDTMGLMQQLQVPGTPESGRLAEPSFKDNTVQTMEPTVAR